MTSVFLSSLFLRSVSRIWPTLQSTSIITSPNRPAPLLPLNFSETYSGTCTIECGT